MDYSGSVCTILGLCSSFPTYFKAGNFRTVAATSLDTVAAIWIPLKEFCHMPGTARRVILTVFKLNVAQMLVLY